MHKDKKNQVNMSFNVLCISIVFFFKTYMFIVYFDRRNLVTTRHIFIMFVEQKMLKYDYFNSS